MKPEKIAIAADHAGYALKEELIDFLHENGYAVQDFGTNSEESTDYADYVHPLAGSIEHHENNLGIIICGSANGVNMTANKHKGVRSALCWRKDVALLAREHNDANVLALPARFLTSEEAKEIVFAFLNATFAGGRHIRRVAKIACP